MMQKWHLQYRKPKMALDSATENRNRIRMEQSILEFSRLIRFTEVRDFLSMTAQETLKLHTKSTKEVDGIHGSSTTRVHIKNS